MQTETKGEQQARERVLLLHGLMRGAGSMRPLRYAFTRAGRRAETFRYPSSRHDIQSHVRALAERCRGLQDEGVEQIHFVTHSLGGLVVRGLLQAEGHPAYVGRLVMVAPPNGGSAMARRVLGWPGLRTLYGPSGQDLRDPRVIEQICALPRGPFMVIAGVRSFDWRNPTSYLGRSLLEPPHDGTVTVAETMLDGASELLLVDESHTFLPSHPEVIAAALRFIGTRS